MANTKDHFADNYYQWFLGIAVAMSSNISVTMLTLSKQYTTAIC